MDRQGRGAYMGWNRSTGFGVALAASVFAAGSTARADLNDVLAKITDRATQARDRAAEAKAGVNEIRARIAAGASNLTDEVRTAIADGVVLLKEQISIQYAGQAAFESEHCEEFSAQLVAMLKDVQAVENRVDAMLSKCGPGSPLDGSGLQALIELIETAPCSVLYPLYAVNIDFCLLSDLDQTVDALDVVRNALGDEDDSEAAAELTDDDNDPLAFDAALFDARLESTKTYRKHYNLLTKAGKQVKKSAGALKKVGALLETQGEANTEATVGVHGYALVTVKFNKAKELSIALKSTAGFLEKIAADVESKLKEAETVSTMNLILANQEEILRNQEELLQGR